VTAQYRLASAHIGAAIRLEVHVNIKPSLSGYIHLLHARNILDRAIANSTHLRERAHRRRRQVARRARARRGRRRGRRRALRTGGRRLVEERRVLVVLGKRADGLYTHIHTRSTARWSLHELRCEASYVFLANSTHAFSKL